MITNIVHAINVVKAVVREHAKVITRSPKWSGVRKSALINNPFCECCGSTKLLQVHHRIPFHLKPELELDPKNLIVLCMDKTECHLLVGHGNNFKKYNPYITADCMNVEAKSISLLEAAVLAKKNALFLPADIK